MGLLIAYTRPDFDEVLLNFRLLRGSSRLRGTGQVAPSPLPPSPVGGPNYQNDLQIFVIFFYDYRKTLLLITFIFVALKYIWCL